MKLVNKQLIYKFKSGGITRFLSPSGPIQRQYFPVKTSYIDIDKLVSQEAEEDYASSIKPDPDIDKIVEDTWKYENPNNKGLLKDGTWMPYYDPVLKQWLQGPGLDFKKNGNPEFANGATTEQINNAVRRKLLENLDSVNEYLKLYTNRPDTVSTSIKEGLMDIRYLVGNLGAFKLLGKAIAEGDLEGILRESQVKIKNDKGEKVPDTRRNNLRAPKFTYQPLESQKDFQWKLTPIGFVNENMKLDLSLQDELFKRLNDANNNSK